METLYDVIWSTNSGIGRAIVLVICAVAIYAWVCAAKHIKRYRSFELAQLLSVERTLREALTRHVDGAPEVKEPKGPVVVSIAKLRDSALPGSIIGDRLAILSELRSAQVKVSVASLQQMTAARESSRASLRFPSFAVGFLMLIGLLGTFIGIAMIVQNIGIADNTTLESLRLQIAGALVGMRTKFSTTLTGLFFAIWLSFLNFRLSHAQSAFFERLDRFTNAQLLPATIPAVEDETLLEKISSQLETSFSRLDDLAKRNMDIAAEVSALQSAFTSIVDNVRKNTRSESPERLQGVIAQLTRVMEQVVSMNESVRQMVTSLPNMLASTNSAVQRLTDRSPNSVASPVAEAAGGPMFHINSLVLYSQQKFFKIVWGVLVIAAVVGLLFFIFR